MKIQKIILLLGYKNLIMCDAKSGLPIYEVTLTGIDVSSLINF